jgi:hypothetical protein
LQPQLERIILCSSQQVTRAHLSAAAQRLHCRDTRALSDDHELRLKPEKGMRKAMGLIEGWEER